MTSNFEHQDRQDFTYYLPGRWVSYVTQAVTAGITKAVTVAITVAITIMVLVGGLWLAYVKLPANVFYIILAVLIADIGLGIVARFVISRR